MQRLKLRRLYRRLRHDERGASSVIVAIVMVVILGMSALVVDVGAIQARKAQLQDAADAAALAIAQECVVASGTMIAACDSVVQARAGTTANTLALANVTDSALTVEAPTFNPRSVKVTVSSVQPGVFSGVFGVDSSRITATATAQWQEPAMPMPLAFNSCAFPAASDTSRIFLRYDLLAALDFRGCGVVTDLLAPGWITTPFARCEFDVRLLTFVSGILTKQLFPASCTSMLSTLKGKVVLLPVYDGLLDSLLVDGVLLQRFEIKKYAMFEVTGYDFSSLSVLTGSYVSYDSDLTTPRCDLSILIVNTCEGLQGLFHGFVTPDQAEEMVAGVKLIE